MALQVRISTGYALQIWISRGPALQVWISRHSTLRVQISKGSILQVRISTGSAVQVWISAGSTLQVRISTGSALQVGFLRQIKKNTKKSPKLNCRAKPSKSVPNFILTGHCLPRLWIENDCCAGRPGRPAPAASQIRNHVAGCIFLLLCHNALWGVI